MNELAVAGGRRTERTGSLQPNILRLARSPLLVSLAAYLILTLVLLSQYMTFFYKDEIAYVAAAERYARGDFLNAPNSLWGPLVSWLVAIVIKLGASSIVAARTVTIFAGAATLWAVQRLAKTLELSKGLQFVFLLTLVPFLVSYALLGLSDDLLLTALLTHYFSIVVNPRYPDRPYSGLACGILGALSFYAKGFALGFFVVHFTMSNALHWIANTEAKTRRKVIRHAAIGFLIFAAMAAIWVAALHHKYGVVTFGITGKYNYEIVGPEAKDRPALYIGFADPPPSTTVSLWEDPAYFYDLPIARDCCLRPWSPFDSASAFKHQLLLFKLNAGRTLLAFLSYSLLVPAILFAAIAYCFAPFWPSRKNRGSTQQEVLNPKGVSRVLHERKRLTPALMLLTAFIYPIPYTLVFSDERFFWPILIVLMGLGLYLIQVFLTEYEVTRRVKVLVVFLYALSFLPFSIYNLATGHKARHATTSIVNQLQRAGLSGTRFASNADYGTSMIAGYYIHAKYYGSAAPWMSEEEILADLRRRSIQYYFVWDAPAAPRPGMTLVRALRADFRTLAIYRVK